MLPALWTVCPLPTSRITTVPLRKHLSRAFVLSHRIGRPLLPSFTRALDCPALSFEHGYGVEPAAVCSSTNCESTWLTLSRLGGRSNRSPMPARFSGIPLAVIPRVLWQLKQPG